MIIIYITCPNTDTARSISKTVINEKLAACTNILPQMESHYVWDDKYQTENEVVLLIKSTSERYSALEKRVQELHPYDVPCIMALPITQGSKSYLEWIQNSIR